jgi:RNA polymerase sigma factor (sigma-70 family)
MIYKKDTYSEDELIKLCGDNDRKGQEVFYKKYFDTMWSMVRKNVPDDENAMDVLNRGFLKVFQNISKYQHTGSLEGWVRRIMYNTMVDQIRSNTRNYRFIVLEDHDGDALDDQTQPLIEEDLLKIVDTLPPVTKQVFTYFAIEGYGHADIASMLNISEGTSKWHLSTARQKLKKILLNSDNEYIRAKSE